MTTYSRRFAASPARTASNTWRAIVDLIAATGTDAHATLTGIVDAVALLIADEVTATTAAVLVGAGPRIHLYTAHGDDAVSGDNVNEAPFAELDLAGAWTLYLPEHPTEPGLISVLVNDIHVVVGSPPEPTAKSNSASASRVASINLSALETR